MSVVEPEAGCRDEDGPVAGVGGEDEEGRQEEQKGGKQYRGLHYN